MKKTIITTAIAIISIVALFQSGIINSLFIFLLVGAIPGTQLVVPSRIMLLIIITLFWLTMIVLFTNRISSKNENGEGQKKRTSRRLSEV
jgi:uncharacterized membrane protein